MPPRVLCSLQQQAEKADRKQRLRDEQRQREAEEEAERRELQRCIDVERRKAEEKRVEDEKRAREEARAKVARRAVAAIDHGSLAVGVRHREVLLVCGAHTPVADLYKTVAEFTGTPDQQDDITLLAFELT